MTEDQQQLVHHKDFKMKNFCLYNGKKTVKPEIWNITSVELSSDYTSAIIQAESKSNKSEYTLDITPLISNQYKNGIDPYSATVVNELTGVSDWVLDPANNQIKYTEATDGKSAACVQVATQGGVPAYVASRGWANYSCSAFWQFGNQQCTAISGITKTGELSGMGNYCTTEPLAQDEEKTLPLDVVAQKVISNANAGNTNAQNSIVSTFNNITDDILTSDYSEFFEQNKQPK